MAHNPTPVGPLLRQIQSPADLRRLPEELLPQLAEELREFLIHHAAEYGGHFGASLGVVELTVALHYTYQTPEDLLVWDVGHQAYGHKVLTGRRDRFHTNRLKDGISGFPKRDESIYDTFGVGHSSTSISAALGIAEALKHLGQTHRKVVAVIGDGALTAGLAYEGLNNVGALQPDLLIILNDNQMSIDPNVGAIKDYLAGITASRTYNRFRDEVWKLLTKIQEKLGAPIRDYAARLEEMFIFLVSKPAVFFESLGLRYFGPVNGHDVLGLTSTLRDLRSLPGPKLLHCRTVKGKGFAPAEKDPIKWHAPAFRFDPRTGEALFTAPPKPTPPRYQDVFGETVIELAEQDSRVVAVTPAMLSGSGLTKMHKLMPHRCYDVGIAEQHAVTFSAGLATQGMKVFCNIYSTFLQRAYDQVIHDVAIQNLPVIFCLDRAGAVGADGATHQGLYDIAYLRPIPNLILSAPLNESELRNLMYTALHAEHPFVIRYPRGNGVLLEWRTPFEEIPIGKGRLLREGETVALLTYGHIGNEALAACAQLAEEGLFPAVYDLRFAKPLDEDLLHEVAQKYRYIITVEDGVRIGGIGSAVLEWFADQGYHLPIRRLAAPDIVLEHATQAEQYALCGYDRKSIAEAVRQAFQVSVHLPAWKRS
ncbi:MAG: 1-deoxy-D-xylulose-5-phosphate synthase [Bacteroidia bacterium]|jgi:1-deoxy-D-xylulose-5-phosphate synthase|nr:1-deoxy-D-xylulose-5-phosphate synthase [Bacteroidia bacterium]GIV23570.1 MAG: 1-deoxy-D-xylulose-5-phosphate synthase [Bacteroidia bacterium]